MSAVDPLAGAAAAPDADLAALIDTELAQLAADAQALRGLLVEDAVVTARVLPSNGLTDLLEIAGRRVPASLPPTVRPGDVLQVRVTGFDGDRILLQIVGTGADAAVETPALPQIAPSAAAFVASSIQPAPGTLPAVPVPPDGGYAVPGTPGGTDATAPGAAASDGAAGMDVPLAIPSVRPGVGTAFTSVVSRANVAPSQAGDAAGAAQTGASGQGGAGGAAGTSQAGALGQTGMPPRVPVTGPGEPTSIEARLAAARASLAQRTTGFDLDSAAPGAGAPGSRFVAPPQIAERTALPNANADGGVRGGLPGAYRNASLPGAGSSAAGSAAALPGSAAAGARASALAAYAEPVALLRALRLPVTPSNVASAALALQRPEHLPDALAALERALPRASDDPNVATLRTLLSFVGRIDPRSPALAAQIAAFVDHAVDGAEPKLATLLAASQAAAASADAASSVDGGAASSAGTGTAPSAAASAAGAAQPPALDMPSLSAALAAERGAALGADLKQTLLAVAANPATPEALAPSLAGALTALTAVQVSAAQTLAANPDGLAFTIPLSTPSGTANAHISVKRDAPDGRGGARVDPDNFRIAFVLDTAHYGTVAIDLVTVGRDVTVDVRTEAAPSMRAFRDALGALTARLESLRYRVASAGASVGTTSTVAVEAPPARPYDPDATVDRSA